MKITVIMLMGVENEKKTLITSGPNLNPMYIRYFTKADTSGCSMMADKMFSAC